ncbi:MAG: hypothetical protein M3361_18915 [Candidatus Tectomicrobia bacterium]|nr:hypothetical protein [Candidatus Tectomicrobia bacterium]
MTMATTSLSWTPPVMTCFPILSRFLTKSQFLTHVQAPTARGRAVDLYVDALKDCSSRRAEDTRRDHRPSGLEPQPRRRSASVARAGERERNQRLTVSGPHLTAMEMGQVRLFTAYHRSRRTGQSVGDGAMPRKAARRGRVTPLERSE